MARRLAGSSHGRALLAIREDEVAAEAMGVDTTGYKVRAFVLSAAFAGLAGGLLVHRLLLVTPRMFTFVRSIEVVAMVVLGGMGSMTGSVVAASVLTIAPEWLRAVDQWRMVIYSLLLIVAHADAAERHLRHARDLGHAARPLPPQGLAAGHAAAGRRDRRSHRVTAPVLEARQVTMRFGGLKALADFELALHPRELVGLIGPNGAGKTTAFNAITGVYAPSERRRAAWRASG